MLRNLIVTFPIILCAFFSAAHAVTVHKWTDANGVTHFSDEPAPHGTVSDTLSLEKLDTNSAATNEDFYSIANQWQRLKAERDADRARKDAKAQRRAAERLAALELEAAEQSSQQQSNPVFVGPVNQRGFWGGGPLPYGARWGDRGRGFGRGGDIRGNRGFYGGNAHGNRGVHPNYHSPFHDRAQPQAIRPKSFSNRRSAYRAPSRGSNAGFYVRF